MRPRPDGWRASTSRVDGRAQPIARPSAASPAAARARPRAPADGGRERRARAARRGGTDGCSTASPTARTPSPADQPSGGDRRGDPCCGAPLAADAPRQPSRGGPVRTPPRPGQAAVSPRPSGPPVTVRRAVPTSCGDRALEPVQFGHQVVRRRSRGRRRWRCTRRAASRTSASPSALDRPGVRLAAACGVDGAGQPRLGLAGQGPDSAASRRVKAGAPAGAGARAGTRPAASSGRCRRRTPAGRRRGRAGPRRTRAAAAPTARPARPGSVRRRSRRPDSSPR